MRTSRPLQNNSPSSTNVTEVTASEKLIRSRIRIVNLFNSRQEHIQVFIGLSPLITKHPVQLTITARQGSCGEVMFSVVFLSVCSQWGPHVTSIHNAIGESQVTWGHPRPVQTYSLGPPSCGPCPHGDLTIQGPSPITCSILFTLTSPYRDPPKPVGKRAVSLRLKGLLVIA